MSVELLRGDCLELMPTLPDGCADMILCDLPYGTTACKWDSVIPFEPLWEQYRRLIKPNGAIVLTASQPFTTDLINSGRAWYKYSWAWIKSKPNGWQHAKNRPMQAVEDVAVFSPAPMGHVGQLGERRMTYNPQGVTSAGGNTIKPYTHGRTMGARANQIGREYEAFTGFPSNVLHFPNVTGKQADHPTQKPVALFEYLIRTYTHPDELVLDNCAGSGTTGVAALNTGRRAILIEREPEYCDIIRRRLADTQPELMRAA